MTTITISLPPPDIIQNIDFETILSEVISDILVYMPDQADTIYLESDPINELAQSFAYRIQIERAAANNQAQSLMLALAERSQLDQLAELPFFGGIKRLVITPANNDTFPPTAPVYESDEKFKQRMRLSLHSLSVAGPSNAYISHTMNVDPSIIDVAVDRPKFERIDIDVELPAGAFVIAPTYSANLTDPMPYDIAITVMTSEADAVASPELLNLVTTALNADDVRPFSDNPRVRSVGIVDVIVNATIFTYPAVDQDNVIALAHTQLLSKLEKIRKIGNDLTLSTLYAGLTVEGVQRVEITNLQNNVIIENHQVFNVIIDITHGGTDE